MELPLFFESEPETLFGVLHQPERAEPNSALIICHPFGEEKLWAHRVAVNLARETARRGQAAFRFDMRGHGDSSGSTEECTPDSFLADIDAAIKTLQRRCPTVRSICLLGLRFGATLSLLYANRFAGIDCLILMEPIMDGSRYMQDLLRINLATQLAVYGKVRLNREALVAKMKNGASVNVDGYLVSASFFEQCNAINLADHSRFEAKHPILVMQIAPRDSQKDRIDLKALANSNSNFEFLKVTEPPFWREIKPYTSRTKNVIREAIGWWETHRGS